MMLLPNQPTAGESASEVPDTDYYVLGGGHVGVSVARQLQAKGRTVSVVDESRVPSEIRGLRGDPADVGLLAEIGVSDASTVVVATPSDARNLLIAQLVRVHLDVSKIVVLANVPDRYDLIAEAGHDPICATAALSAALVDAV